MLFEHFACRMCRMNVGRKIVAADFIHEGTSRKIILSTKHIFAENTTRLADAQHGTAGRDAGVLESRNVRSVERLVFH